MGRAIVSAPSLPVVREAFPQPVEESPPTRGTSGQQQEKPDTYRERLFKYIPAEVVTLYVGLSTIVASAKDAPHVVYWVVFFAGLIGTPYYLWRIQSVTAPTQLIVSTAAFAVWVFALGGPFADIAGYKQVYSAVLLPLFTFFVAGISPAQPKQSRHQAPSVP
jgi:hypothetical protein